MKAGLGSPRLRVASVSVRSVLLTGAWAGLVPGLFVGALLGGAVSWLAGATLAWMDQLSYTTGIDVQLLPFGDRFATLQALQADWFLTVPVSSLAVGLFAALIGVLTAAVVSASYGSLLTRLEIVLEADGADQTDRDLRSGGRS